jgi:hypothetical protein
MLGAILLGAFALPVWAQLQVGDYAKLNLNGNLTAGYGGTFGNLTQSEHSLTAGGDMNLTGAYYNPNFLSFNFRPYYNRSQSNSMFQSIGDSSGFDAGVDIFSGSHFPGFVSFGKSYNSTGQFGIPGTSSLVTHGDSRQFGIGWSTLFPGLPTLSATFSTQASASSIYGTEQTSNSLVHNLTLRSDYTLAGFRLNGSFLRLSNDMTLPSFLDGLPPQQSDGASNTFQVSASHAFPLHGSFSAGFSRSTFGYGSGAANSNQSTTANGSADSVSAGLSIHPFSRLTTSFTSNYSDNLSGTIAQQIISAGGPVPQLNLGQSRSLLVSGDAHLWVIGGLSVQGGVNRQEQFFLGQAYGLTQVNAGASYFYARPLFGTLNFSVGMTDTATKEGNTGAGLAASVSFYRKIRRYEVSGSFMYGQYVQTLLAIATSSSFSYSASVSRKLSNHTFWSGSFGAGRSGFTNNGSSNHSERGSSSFSYRGYAANIFYSQSSGTSLLTANGLVATPAGLPPGVLPPDAVVLFNARSLGVGGSGTLFRRMVITGAYARGNGTTISPLLTASNHNQMYTALARYPFRKMYFTAGFTRFMQGISTAGTPVVVNSYNFGIARWFNVF